MDGAGYQRGGLAVVACSIEPRDGDVVVARVEGDVLVRRYHRTGTKAIELRPEGSNPEHATLLFTRGSTDLEIVGVVVGKIVAERRGGGHEEEPAPETD